MTEDSIQNLKIALVVPKSRHYWESLAMGYLASYSYKFGFRREQYRFFSAEFDSDETIVSGCADADFIGFSVTSFQMKHGLELVDKIRKVNSHGKIVFGGYGVTGLTPEQLIELYGDKVDYFAQGPGEESWVEFLTNPSPPRVIKKGIHPNLDEVPFPDRDLIRIERNFKKLESLGEGRKTSMEMVRNGCPYHCIFCAAGSYAKPIAKPRSAENIIDEMILLRDKYGMDRNSMLLLSDAEVFMTKTVEQVAELKRARQIEFKFGMNVVSSTINQPQQIQVLEKLTKAGLTEVWMGVESDPTLMHLTKKPITPESTRKAFRITRDLGLIRKAYFILGFTPEETRETVMNRIDFINELDPDVVGFTIYIPVPGSPGYNHELHKNIDYSNYCEYWNDFTRTNTLANAELQDLQKLLVEYFRGKNTYRQREVHVT